MRSTFLSLAYAATVVASPLELQGRSGCSHDNLLRCFIDQRYSVIATQYCSALEPFTTTVATATATT